MIRISFRGDDERTYMEFSWEYQRIDRCGPFAAISLSRPLFEVRVPRRLQLWFCHAWIVEHAFDLMFVHDEVRDPLVLAIQTGLPRWRVFTLRVV